MNYGQRIIKYLAILFAIFLIINIFFGIIFSLNLLFGFDKKDKDIINSNNEEKYIDKDFNTDIKNIIIELKYTNVEIKTGEFYKIDTDNDNLIIKKENGLIIIKEKDKGFRTKLKNLTIYLPEDSLIKEVDIENGAGTLNIDNLKVENLSLELGAGKVNMNNLKILKECEIESGAGSIDINNSKINNLDFEGGIGSINIEATLIGKNSIDVGIGKVELLLLNSIDNYTFKLDKGLGNIEINNKKINVTSFGSGTNEIYIQGGIGNIEIKNKEI